MYPFPKSILITRLAVTQSLPRVHSGGVTLTYQPPLPENAMTRKKAENLNQRIGCIILLRVTRTKWGA
jgi:hypothetical protein